MLSKTILPLVTLMGGARLAAETAGFCHGTCQLSEEVGEQRPEEETGTSKEVEWSEEEGTD